MGYEQNLADHHHLQLPYRGPLAIRPSYQLTHHSTHPVASIARATVGVLASETLLLLLVNLTLRPPRHGCGRGR